MKNRESGLPFDDFRTLLKQLPGPDENAGELTRAQVADRFGANSGILGELCEWYAKWSGRTPLVSRPVLTQFAGTHGVDSSRDAALLQEVEEISSGGSPVNRICHQNDLGLKVLDLALQVPVADITQEAALDEKSCAGTIAFGMEAIAGGTDLLCAAAIETDLNVSCLAMLSVLWDLDISTAAGETGHTELVEKVRSSVAGLDGRNIDALEILRRLGGREAAAICGAILAARSQHIPVLLAGPTAITCAAILEHLERGAAAHCKLAQSTGNPALDGLVENIGLGVLFNEFLTPVPGVQIGLGVGLIRSACLTLADQK